ncbi:Arc family DNA-binding protein [Geodermatophilus sp. DF01-2]|uniref:FitA-like ribbon-helix-helix domain-containing protein n=1 Tax=Geodermatophilus sp. DF01-2 TaxID=2559610 RepID=UPI0010735DB6|nr:Arc family DNA-binding protein [Geodermatophilus sp. DF01_2]TFV55769.1 Arc family DNA-binding protein [Geodermatophilus sp. DF01_2]
MATLTIRDLDDGIRDKLRVRAAEHGRSMEAEVREILAAAVADPEPEHDYGWVDRLRAPFLEIGGVEPDELVIPPRTGRPRYVDFGE